MNKIDTRYEFTMIFDVENKNFNEDISCVNDFAIDSETDHSIITDLYLKRKIRGLVKHACEDREQYKILFKADKPLTQKYKDAYEACGLIPVKKGKDKTSISVANEYMCKNYYDVRAFGAVMNDNVNPCGKV